MSSVSGRTVEHAGAHLVPRRFLPIAAWTLLCANILLQIAFPLTGGGTTAMTTGSALLLSVAMLCAAGATHGLRGALTLLLVAGGGGLLAETVGVHTGVPFGAYSYTGALQPELFGVPVAVPAAWIMMSWPAFVVATRLAADRTWLVIPVGAYALTAWDVFLDPEMVDNGYWQWDSTTPSLPGVDGIPLSNFAGWLMVSLIIMTCLSVAMRTGRGSDAPEGTVPLVAYLWTYFSSVIGHLVFFGRPMVAVVGGVLMGVIAIPLAISLVREVRRARR